MYHLVAVGLGGIAGVGTVVGLTLLIYRRRSVGPVFSATTKNDKLMYVFLAVTILLGLATTVNSNILGHHDYPVAPYFRSIFYLQPRGELMTAATLLFRRTSCRPGCCSRSGRSPGWCTCSALRWAT